MEVGRIKELNKIALPLIIQSIASIIIGLTDQMLIGRISIYAYSAVGVVSSLLIFLSGVFGFTAVSFNILGAKSIGENDIDKFRDGLTCSFIIDIFVGIAFAIITLTCGKFILTTFYGFEGEILEEALKYAYMTCPYMLIQMMLFTFNAYFKVKKNTKHILFASVACSALNVVIDYILIFGKFGFKPMGVIGNAIGTIVSLLVNLIIYIYIGHKDMVFALKKAKSYLQIMKKQIKISIPLIGQELLEGSIFVIFINAILSKIGVVELGSYLLVKSVIDVALMAMYMYGSAILTLVSEKIGSNDFNSGRKLPYDGIKIAMLIYLIASILLIAFRDYVPRIISNDPGLIKYASEIVIFMVLLNLFNPVQTIYKYALQACNDAKYVLYVTAIINIAVLLIICLLTFLLNTGIMGVFLGLFINYLSLTILYAVRYNKVLLGLSSTTNI